MRCISRLSLSRHYNRSNENPLLGEIAKFYLLVKVTENKCWFDPSKRAAKTASEKLLQNIP
jgi:hypothetical protein